MSVEVGDVLESAGEQIVDCDHFVATRHECVTKVRSDESGSASHYYQHWLSTNPLMIEPGPHPLAPVEDVACVNDGLLRHEFCDLVGVQPPEFIPLGQHRQHSGSCTRRVWIGADLH